LEEYSKRNCTVIEGPLVLHSTLDDVRNETVTTAPITPLNSIVEITGTLEVFKLEKNVDNLGQILPNLAVVRGHPHHRYPNVNVSVVIAYNEYLKSVNLTKLTHIGGDYDDTAPILLWKNKMLQYIHTVKWEGISTNGVKAVLFGNPEQGEACPQFCNKTCWSQETCQTLLRETCSATDSYGNCNCSSECLSSCNGPGNDSCTSCKNFHFKGQCVPSCPNGTFIVAGWRCVENCTQVELEFGVRGSRITHRLFAFNGKCVSNCPDNYTGDSHTNTCVPCSTSNCGRRCPGGIVRSLEDAKLFQDCVHVEGNLEINILTDSNENGNLSLYLGRVKHVGGYVTVSNSPRLETLEFLENLTSIGGRNLWALGTEEFYGLVIRNNRNLRSVYWKQQQKLWLGGRTDVQVLITSNYMACEDGIKKLKLPFPFSVAIYDNGILAVCN
jgi:hypothetical protein